VRHLARLGLDSEDHNTNGREHRRDAQAVVITVRHYQAADQPG